MSAPSLQDELLASLKEAVRLVDCYGLRMQALPGDNLAAGRWYADAKNIIAKIERKSGDAS